MRYRLHGPWWRAGCNDHEPAEQSGGQLGECRMDLVDRAELTDRWGDGTGDLCQPERLANHRNLLSRP